MSAAYVDLTVMGTIIRDLTDGLDETARLAADCLSALEGLPESEIQLVRGWDGDDSEIDLRDVGDDW